MQRSSAAPRRDHPRSRGEYAPHDASGCHDPGSSPLSRGIPSIGDVCGPHGGIIPALAGNTKARDSWIAEHPDHPRSRGEYVSHVTGGHTPNGSSPLSRGIRRRCFGLPPPQGIIPALAGNTAIPSIREWPERDHPRSRGEYTVYIYRSLPSRGSSPLSRGIPAQFSR